ncbi:restriction endonuclease subunit S [Melaminivora alkalimesophila]|uniref:Type I restriction enzyme S subunit n=1 Tax=Melaminivora alkalimesophila TaxID=1165852 RepID=A0A317RCG2_9BURK|nr:restriction endonuclease subunit S [Melaminivora alkalimesophila]PWW45974.1 type I restriction enzyme S subunit [Melaminivora alkalimesophila]
MASEWVEARFGSLVLFVSDKLQAKDARIDAYVSTENMVADFGGITPASAVPPAGSVTKFKFGDTLFSNIRTYFKKVWQARFDGCCSNDVLVFRTENEGVLTPDYLHQICRWEKFTELSIRTSKGAKMPRGDKDALASFKFRLPPIEEQRAIAHILGTLDDKIELNRKQNETLEAMARALFKAWFVDFEPVRAKMEGRWQRGQSLLGLPAHLYDLFPDRLVESELGKIPQGWRYSRIGEEVSVCGGSTPSTKEPEFWEGGQHNWATPKDLSTLKFPVLLATGRKITDAGLEKISSGLLPSGTVLLSSRAPVGYLAIAEVPTAINQGFIAMKCDGALPNVFILYWCKENMDAIVGNANGSTFQEISKANFRPIPVVVPSGSVLTSFARSATPLHQQMTENERESLSLAQLRDTLLPQLISGKMRIPDAEVFLKERNL